MDDNTKETILVKIITLEGEDDELSNAIGTLIASTAGKDIINKLYNKAYYKNQLAQEKGQSFARINYTLEKIKVSEIAEYIKKTIVKKGVKHEFISIPKQLIIIPIGFTREELEKPNALKKLFRNNIKFLTIGIVAFGTFMITDIQKLILHREHAIDFPLLVIPLTVIIIGLIIERIWSRKKRN